MANAEPKNVNLRLERFEYRAVFSKTGRAKYISHLDLMRAFQRVFKITAEEIENIRKNGLKPIIV